MQRPLSGGRVSVRPGPFARLRSRTHRQLAAPDAVTRIVVTGGESTGKTTLARQLAEALGAPWVPEFSREYAERIGRPLAAGDVEPIARGQMAAVDAAVMALRQRAAGEAAPLLLVLDTDLVSTTVYADHYYGATPAWIMDAARERCADLYLLCAPDLPWEPDGVRDRPSARAEIHARFAERLRALGATVLPVSGAGESRLAVALAAVRGWRAAAIRRAAPR